MSREAVLIVGSSGNIGISVVIAALKSNLDVLAIVRDDNGQQKVLDNLPQNLPKDRITFVTANPLEETGVEKVVQRVERHELPAFQHVYSTVGIFEPKSPVHTVDIATLRKVMTIGFEANFLAYKATIPYLLTQSNPTWTLITGGAGELGIAGVTALSQGALFSLANVACFENENTNIRFNEVFLCDFVQIDSEVEKAPLSYTGSMKTKSSEFAAVYEQILADKTIKGCRISVYNKDDVSKLKYRKKLPPNRY